MQEETNQNTEETIETPPNTEQPVTTDNSGDQNPSLTEEINTEHQDATQAEVTSPDSSVESEVESQPVETPEATLEKDANATEMDANAANETTESAEPEVEEKPREPKPAHDDFDWSQSNKDELTYSQDEIKRYLNDYEATLSQVAENEVVQGKVTYISATDVLLDLSHKSDGLVSLSEFRDLPDLAVGDMVDVYVENREDDYGQLVLSRRKAKLLKAWESLVDSYENGTIIKGIIVSKTKGGLIVDCSGLETFLPGSQIDIKPIIDYDSYVGKTMEFKVVKINEAIKNAVVSHKALIESDLAEQREAIISGLEKGQVLEGIVKNITDFGAFMDLGGVDGLLYITDISWGRINHPSEVLELNQKINVVVLDFDDNKKRISLGLKQLQPHPWDTLSDEVVEGSTVKGKIVNIEDYGAFLEVTPGVEGLVHVSEITWSNQPVNARDYFELGQMHEAKIVTIDRDDRKMSLSLKQLQTDPWTEIDSKFPLNSRHTGVVKNLTPYGVFVELEEGIGGMVHISDLSWTKRFSHPSEFTQIGENIDIVILEVDPDSRKLSLGHKHIEENPWDTFESVFPVGSYHEATVVRRDDKGAIVQLPYGLEAFAPIKHVRKEDGNLAEVDENLTFKVIEFNRDDKRILVSHLRYLDDIKREADTSVRKDRDQEKKKVERGVRTQQSRVERTTLGELDVFSQLKEQLAEGASTSPNAPGAKRAETKKEEPAAPAEEVKETEVAAEEKSAPVEDKVEETPAEAVDTAKDESDQTPSDEVTETVVEAETEGEESKSEEEGETPSEEKAEEAPEEDAEEVLVAVEVADEPAKAPAEAAADVAPDNLKKVEGIGPKIAQILSDSGITTFGQLANASPDHLREVLLSAGSRYKMFDPETWPDQAKLAAEDKWDELKALQESLSGGRK